VCAYLQSLTRSIALAGNSCVCCVIAGICTTGFVMRVFWKIQCVKEHSQKKLFIGFFLWRVSTEEIIEVPLKTTY
jgi:hypothetical protein